MISIRLAAVVLFFSTSIKAYIYTTENHSSYTGKNCFESAHCSAYQVPVELKKPLNVQKVELPEELWKSIWHLSQTKPNLDHRIKEAWQLGFTGRGVVVAVVDDGLDWRHPDILPNYDQRASYDYSDMDADPMPASYLNDHGTNCAGVVAASITSKCTVGVAFNSKVGGIRLLTARQTEASTAKALNHNMEYVDIYSSSWGPADTGSIVDGPNRLTNEALQRGTSRGRRGKGSIYVFPAGNGGHNEDSCSCDGYINSIHTIGITSATEHGDSPWYGERCTGILATTFSGGNWDVRAITTTSTRNSCTNDFRGTSASVPIASGIIALILEVNPNLGWRDVQHIIVRTANSRGLTDQHWKRNGVGRNVSNTFGYGLLDAAAMANLAKVWKPVPQHICQIIHFNMSRTIRGLGSFTKEINSTESHVVYLEHVQLSITLKAIIRGAIQVHLTSPMGTKSTLLPRRPKDISSEGFNDWHFMTTHLWGEEAKGIWQLEVSNGYWTPAELVRFSLKMYGTMEKPQL